MFSDHSEIKLGINNEEYNCKIPKYLGRVGRLLNNPWLNEESSREIKICFHLNYKKKLSKFVGYSKNNAWSEIYSIY